MCSMFGGMGSTLSQLGSTFVGGLCALEAHGSGAGLRGSAAGLRAGAQRAATCNRGILKRGPGMGPGLVYEVLGPVYKTLGPVYEVLGPVCEVLDPHNWLVHNWLV